MKATRKIIAPLFIILFIGVSIFICYSIDGKFPRAVKQIRHSSPEKNLHQLLLDSLLADGFDFPFGDGNGGGTYSDIKTRKKYSGWYIATSTAQKYELGIHTGEDWNGNGKGNTDLGQPVYSTAKGTVLEAKDFGAPWGNVVYVEHKFAENGKIKTVYSLYAHLNEIKIKKGNTIKRRELIGTIGDGHGSYPAHLHFEVRKDKMKDFEVTYWPSSHSKDVAWVKEHYFSPSEFVKTHRKISLPAVEKDLLVVVKHEYKMYRYKKGKILMVYDVALSQSPLGHKEKQGDNKMPEGEYKIIEKSRGPFYGNYKEFFGPAWMRLNYPNNYDAEAALKKKIISAGEYKKIVSANEKGLQPPKNTALGGGIGMHGWAGDWPLSTRDLTWGCVSMRNKDLDKFYETINEGTKVLILP